MGDFSLLGSIGSWIPELFDKKKLNKKPPNKNIRSARLTFRFSPLHDPMRTVSVKNPKDQTRDEAPTCDSVPSSNITIVVI